VPHSTKVQYPATSWKVRWLELLDTFNLFGGLSRTLMKLKEETAAEVVSLVDDALNVLRSMGRPAAFFTMAV
jgi:hypothetical protein